MTQAEWCRTFFAFDDEPTMADFPALLETAPEDIRAEFDVLRPLLQAVAIYDDEEPGAEDRLAELRNEPDISAATDAVNAFVDENCVRR